MSLVFFLVRRLIPALLIPVSTCAVSSDLEVNAAALYESKCGVCHNSPNDRTPSREDISKFSGAHIYQSMTVGAMAPMAAALSDLEKREIALYLSPAQSGGAATEPNVNWIWGDSSAQMPMAGPLCTTPPPVVDPSHEVQWNGWSPSPDNTRFQSTPGISATNVDKLRVKWAFKYPGSKNGQATIIGERLFVTSMSGAVYALNAKTGCVYWRHDAGWPTRSSVSVGEIQRDGKQVTALFYSDWSKSAVAIDANTGVEIWRTQIEDVTGVQMTGSPTLWKDTLFVPISTGNEAFAASDIYECCKFIGSVVALNASTGEVRWKRFTTDQPNLPYRLNAKGKQMWGPSGGSIWSAPTIDPKRGVIYVSTSNSHTDMPHDGSNSVMAIDIDTGEVVWKNQVWKDDNYINGCPRAANCPEVIGPDFALGASPILHAQANGRELILAGQKSGILWALDPDDDGKVVWKTRLSPGSALGGIVFGPAADETTVYVGISDVITRQGAKPGLYALNIKDGSVLWAADAPQLTCRWKNRFCFEGISQAVSVIPGVVFAGAMNGRFRAHDAATGSVLWEHDTGGAPMPSTNGEQVYGGVMDGAGPTIAGGMVYVHSGYAGRQNANPRDMRGIDGNLLIAYSIGEE